MKIFISWSGQLSKELAEALKNWIPKVLQAAKPFYSPHDISKGSRWNNDISNELDNTKVGLICLTQDNLESPWIMFEAGALSKNVDNSKVCPILFNVETSQIVGPLTQFQATTKFTKEEVHKTVIMLNDELGDLKLKQTDLNEQFEMWWPRLNDIVEKILTNTPPESKTEKRPIDEILEEILTLTRNINIKDKHSRNRFHPRALTDLVEILDDITSAIIEVDSELVLKKLRVLFGPIEHIVRTSTSGMDKEEMISKLYTISNKIEIGLNKIEKNNVTYVHTSAGTNQ